MGGEGWKTKRRNLGRTVLYSMGGKPNWEPHQGKPAKIFRDILSRLGDFTRSPGCSLLGDLQFQVFGIIVEVVVQAGVPN